MNDAKKMSALRILYGALFPLSASATIRNNERLERQVKYDRHIPNTKIKVHRFPLIQRIALLVSAHLVISTPNSNPTGRSKNPTIPIKQANR